MKQATRIIIISVGVLALGGIAYAATRKKKPVKKLSGSVSVGQGSSTSPDEEETLSQGSSDEQHVTQLQEVLNTLHRSANYINNNCGGIKWGYMAGSLSGGNIVNENGVFDARTAKACQYYLNRTQVDLDYLQFIRDKIAKFRKGDQCVYPLAVEL